MEKPNHMTDNDSEKALECLLYGLNQFYQNEEILLKSDVSERCMVFKIAYYMSAWMKTDLEDYDLDVEYNRHIVKLNGKQVSNSKRAILSKPTSNLKKSRIKQNNDLEESLIIPDLIIHSRGEKDFNLAAIEFKKTRAGREKIEFDMIKLQALTESSEFLYKTGYLVVLGKRAYEITAFKSGVEVASFKTFI